MFRGFWKMQLCNRNNKKEEIAKNKNLGSDFHFSMALLFKKKTKKKSAKKLHAWLNDINWW